MPMLPNLRPCSLIGPHVILTAVIKANVDGHGVVIIGSRRRRLGPTNSLRPPSMKGAQLREVGIEAQPCWPDPGAGERTRAIGHDLPLWS